MTEETCNLADIMEEREKARECELCKQEKPGKNYRLCDKCKDKEATKYRNDLCESLHASIRKFQLSGHDKEYNEQRRLFEMKGHKFNDDGTLK